MLALLIGAHLVGDFLLQNDWMQQKSKNTLVCLVHVGIYAQPILLLNLLGIIPLWMVLLIIWEHFFQDRFGLHLKWMKLYKQTPPDKWPVGPLCMDQAMHIGFMWALCLFAK